MKKYYFFFVLILILGCSKDRAVDPLPSWNESVTKKAIIEFVKNSTEEGSKGFIQPEDRIATFDNDGTLWSEVPTVEVSFINSQLKQALARNPALMKKEPFRTVTRYGEKALTKLKMKDIIIIMTTALSGMTEDEFASQTRTFLQTAQHPKYRVPYQNLTYKPMTELVSYLQQRGFKVYICSGGDVAFMRVIAPEIYNIPPENVIGAYFADKAVDRAGKLVIMRTPKLITTNDQAEKPVNILQRIGRRPVFAAGNVRSGGDIEHLRYSSEGSLPSLQLMINHDDADREAAYSEPNNASLIAAKKFNWHVVSMKEDWKQIFNNLDTTNLTRVSKKEESKKLRAHLLPRRLSAKSEASR
ncbi:MAG: haloacid dehalogenase-like hydrolase [Bdellovibrionales bacterium]|nr:haloacid dehalogenase-like hydrolase [Bdellovibrionales bacterium]